ncbi:MAG: DUF4405 domain-containing protein [Desulforhopalus sp.]|nr:DUF4405 domain-containing protein [Desulforhopalus sp.]
MTVKNFSTTPTIGLFLIISVTGILLLFHVGGGNVKMLHEWLGIIFVVCGILHAVANWRLMKRYLGGMKAAVIAFMLVSAVTYSLVATPSDTGGSPIKSVITQVKKAPLSTLAGLYGQRTDRLVKKLEDNGLTVASVDASLEEIARQNKVAAEKIIVLIATRPEEQSNQATKKTS